MTGTQVDSPPATSTRRVIRWQKRAMLKARLFDASDKFRRQRIAKGFEKIKGPDAEVENLRKFFLAYPRCIAAPVAVRAEQETSFHTPKGFVSLNAVVYVTFDFPTYDPEFEYLAAAAEIALKEQEPLRSVICLTARLQSVWHIRRIDEVKDEVARLKETGLWLESVR